MALDNLPGTKAEFQDGSLRITRPPTLPKVTLLGVTNNPGVTACEPVRIETDDDAILFDNMYDSDGVTLNAAGVLAKPSELTLAVAEAFNAGAQNVEVVAIPVGTGTDLSTKLSVAPTSSSRFTGLAALYGVLRNTDVRIVVPVGAYIDATGLLGTQNFGYQLANFLYQNSINSQTCIGMLGTTPPAPLVTTPTGIPTLAQLETWVAALETYDTSGVNGADFTIWDGVTDAGDDGIPDTYAGWATTDESIPTGAPPRWDGQVVTDRRSQPVDIGAYITVTPEWTRFFNDESSRMYPTLGFYPNSSAAAYAGLTSKLPSRIGTTNQYLPGTTPIRRLSPAQANRLINQRYAPMLVRSLGYVVVQDNTFAHYISRYYRSDYHLNTTVRITHDAMNVVRARVERFIGKPINAANRNALEQEIDEGLGIMQSHGALEWFNAELLITAAMKSIGQAQIDLSIQPAFELLTVNTFVSLTAGQV